MSTQVDERVVAMRFDNAQFERETKTTMGTLDRLKEKLNFAGHAKGMDEITKSARRVDMSTISDSADKVSVRFSYMQGVVMNVLNNITTSAYNAGKRIVSALTIDPVKTGLQEYETKMNAVQVIRANTMGKNSMEEIMAALDELNTYADKTIYNFAQMTSNVGKFVAQGLDVKQATNAIQGMANLAAASGASAEDMSRATYQMSQALGGVIRKIDWNSLRNANMATTTLKDTLMDIARVEGIDIDAMIKDKGTFEDTLEKGWLTGEMFTKAMNIYSGVYSDAELKAQGFNDEQVKRFQEIAEMAASAATEVKTITQLWDVLRETVQSGWTQTWEYVIGDFETAKADLSKAQNYLSDILNKMADARNELLKGWNEGGGRDMLIDSIVNIFNAVKSIVVPIKDAFRDIFPPTTVEQLLKLTEGIKNFTSRLILGDEASANLKSTFRGLFAVVDIVWKVFKAALTAAKPLFDIFGKASGGILGATGSLGEWLVKLNEFIDETGILTNVAEGVALVFKKMIDFVKKYFMPFVDAIKSRFEWIVNGASDMKEGVTTAVNALGQAIENSTFVKVINGLWKIVSTIAKSIFDILGSAIGGVIEMLAGSDFSGIFDLLNSISLGTIAIAIGKFVKALSNGFEELCSFTEIFVSLLDSVKGCLEAWQSSIKANIILKIAAAIGILAVSLLLLASIDSVKLTVALTAVTGLFAELMGSMAIFSKVGLTMDMAKASLAMVSFSSAILVLAIAMRIVASADMANIAVAFTAISGLMWMMVMVAERLASDKDSKKLIYGTTRMIMFAGAIFVLAAALRLVAGADIKSMSMALVNIVALMTAMVIVAEKMSSSDPSKMLRGTYQMILFAGAIFILASALRMISDVGITDMLTGLLGVAALMAGVVLVSNFLKANTDLALTGVGLIAMAAAIDLLVIACKELGKLELGSLAKGISAIVILMAAFAGFSHIVNTQSATIIWTSIAMIPMAAAMIIFANAVKRFGELDTKTLGHGLVGLAAGLGALTAALVIMGGNSTGVLKAAGAISIIAGAMLILAGALLVFEKISWESLGKAGAVLGVILVIMAAFAVLSHFPNIAAVLEAACVIMLQLGTALLAMGAAFLMAGVGCLAFSASVVVFGLGLASIAIGIEALAKVMPVVAENFIETLNILIDGFINFGPRAALSLANGISMLCEAIVLSVDGIVEAFTVLCLEFGEALLTDVIPGLSDAIWQCIVSLCEDFVDYVPELVDILLRFFIAVFDSLALRIPELGLSFTNLIMSIFRTLIDCFRAIDFRVVLDGLGALAVMAGILGSFAYLYAPAMAGIGALTNMLLYLAGIVAIFGLIWKLDFVRDLIEDGGSFLETLGVAIGSFIGGIVGGIGKGATSQLPEMADDLSEFMRHLTPFIDGVKNVDEGTMNSMKSLAGAILAITASNVIESLTSWVTGENSLVEFGKQLAAFGPYFSSYYESVKGIDGEVIVASSNAAKALSEMASNLPNQGGLAAWIAGDNTLAQFARELALFGPSLKSYADSITGLDANLVTNSVNAAKSISEFAANLPNQGGLASWIMGDNTLTQFAAELAAFGPSLKAYGNSVAGLDGNVVLNSANAAKALAEMANILPKVGGLVSLWEGSNTLDSFGLQLVSFGPFMAQYAKSVAGIDGEVVKSSASAASTLANMANLVSTKDYGGLIDFGTKLAKFGINFKEFSINMKGVSIAKIQAATTALREITNIVGIISNASASGLGSINESLGNLATNSIDGLVSAFTNAKPRVTAVATDLVSTFIEGIKSSYESVVEAFDGMFVNILTAANNQYDSFYSAGSYVVDGFAAGITDRTWAAEAKAKAMAEAALEAAKEALDENSPSKEFYKIGAFAGEGFVNAFSDYESKSHRAGFSIAESARNGLTSAVSKLNDFISNGLDTQPTIRPVLDLSDVESGAGTISRMLGFDSSIGVLTDVGAINTMMNRRNQNGANSEVVSAINKLGRDLGNNIGPSYNINGITYDKGSEVADAIETLVRATIIEGRS